MPTDKDRRWTSLYKGAMLEFDPQRLRERISLANNAIKRRLARLYASDDNHGEKRHLANASGNLRVTALSRLARCQKFMQLHSCIADNFAILGSRRQRLCSQP